MAELIIEDRLAERLRAVAKRENRSVEAVLETLLDRYAPSSSPKPEAHQVASQEEAIKQLHAKLYRMAREYWAQVGDKERLALTDAELDEQFWLIDDDGIPRLKSDAGKFTLKPDPLEAIVGILDVDITDMSTTVRETLDEYYWKKYGGSD
jgi:hypothetical protein